MAEKEHIEREKLYKDVSSLEVVAYKSDNEDFDNGVKFILEKLDAIPAADVVEVCRCKDCEHCHEYQKWNFDRYLGCNFNGEIYEVSPKHFCSYGERKVQV